MLTISAVVLLHLGVIAVLVGVNGCRTTTGFEKDGDLGAYTGAAGVPAASPAYTPGVPVAGLNEAPKPVAPAPTRPVVTAVGKGNTHAVVAGESLWVIARREGVSLDALCAANGLERNAVLRVGQKVVIPDGSTPVAPVKASSGSSKPAAPAGPSPLALPPGGFGGFGGGAPAAPAAEAPKATEAPVAPKPAEPAKPASPLALPAGGFGGFGGGAPAAPAAPATR